MKHKPIRLDWDELEVAFTNHDEEIVYYLDLVTGKVILEGEGEDDDFDDEDDDFSANTVLVTRPAAVDDSTRAYVKPVTNEIKLEWMKSFLAEKDNGLDNEANTQLKQALESDDAPEALGAFLRGADEARDIWYLYRSNQLHEHMQAWLGEQEITPIDPPPWS
jgi:hypothetical protein